MAEALANVQARWERLTENQRDAAVTALQVLAVLTFGFVLGRCSV